MDAESLPDTRPNRSGGLVVVLSKDLFFGMRIRTVLRQLGYVISIARDVPAFTNQLVSGDRPAVLGLIDFNQPVAWKDLELAIGTAIPMIAFGSHKDVDGFRAARAAGVARVISNGEFSRLLPALAKKYANLSP